jgi:nicotinamidase-related amidase/alkylated DNA repair dioxygenase AlkB/glutathione S-transferase
MFDIDQAALPHVATRQALLVLDFQNDFISEEATLPVKEPAGFLDNIIKLVPAFRDAGTIIWIRSQFEASRPVNTGKANDENVITDNEIVPMTATQRRIKATKRIMDLYGKMMEASEHDDDDTGLPILEQEPEEPSENEAFLSVEPGKGPSCAKPISTSSNFAQPIVTTANLSKDLFIVKSHYSAFKSGQLLQTLRSQFITKLFLCGILTNISVYATAMDAARYGIAITLVEDCLGYRSKDRHDQALRSLDEATGCDIFTSAEVIREISGRPSVRQAQSGRPTRRTVRPPDSPQELDEMMGKLKLRSAPKSTAAGRSKSPNVAGKPHKSEGSSQSPIVRESDESIAASDESWAEISVPPKAQEPQERKRVPTKIRARRRPSSTKPESSTTSANLKSLPKKTEASTSHPQESNRNVSGQMTGKKRKEETDTDRVAKAAMSIEPDLSTLLEVDTPRNETFDISTIKTPKSEPSPSFVSTDTSTTSLLESVHDSDATCVTPELIPLCEGDTCVIPNILGTRHSRDIFERVRDEVQWQKMSHQGGEVPRLVAVQGVIEKDGSIPVYRHPADESPPLLGFTPAVSMIRREVEKRLGHPVNHCLIQFYRSGTDYISEHSDKTLDIAPDTYIANVSLGAQRTMTFRTKRQLKEGTPVPTEDGSPRSVIKARLPHNSMCKMGLITNMRWLHSIRQDKRLAREKTIEELDYGGARISLTFRLIGTFLTKDQDKIWGQGAVAKHKKHARRVINGNVLEAKSMIEAFGKENRATEFDWPEVYGYGFDVLHMSNEKKLFLSGYKVANLRVKLAMTYYGLEWTAGSLSPVFNFKDDSSPADAHTGLIPADLPIKFVDNDLPKSTVQGDLAILLYLNAVYGHTISGTVPLKPAQVFTRLQEALALDLVASNHAIPASPAQRGLTPWEKYLGDDNFVAGPEISLADFAFWPGVHAVVEEVGDGMFSPNLKRYYEALLGTSFVRMALEAEEKVGA